MKLGRAIPAGLVDVGLAALASFAVQFYAVRTLSPEELGLYALFFAAFVLATTVPQYVVFKPSEVISLGLATDERLGLLSQSIPLGLSTGVVSMTFSLLPLAIASDTASSNALVAFAVTAGASSVLSPIQDHVRRMLHIAGASWRASIVSIIQLVTVLSALVVFSRSGVPVLWRPFGALVAANAVSGTVGIIIARVPSLRVVATRLRLRELAQWGRWLLIMALIPSVANFAVNALVAILAGSEALGLAEAARIVARPVLVLSAGVAATVGPRSMEAAMLRDEKKARRHRRLYSGVVAGLGGLYFIVVGFNWALNPLPQLLPTAYLVTGLVAVTIIGNLLNGIVLISRSELIGARREVALAGIEAVGNLLRLTVAAAAATLRSFAIPLSIIALGLARWLGYRRATRELYSDQLEPPGS
jgi:O-antigen/teichoic acid export membrane protein